MGYVSEKLIEALGGPKWVGRQDMAYGSWTPNNIRSIVIMVDGILIEPHLGPVKVTRLDPKKVLEDVTSSNYAAPTGSALRIKDLACLEEIILEEAMFTGSPKAQRSVAEFLADKVNAARAGGSRLRMFTLAGLNAANFNIQALEAAVLALRHSQPESLIKELILPNVGRPTVVQRGNEYLQSFKLNPRRYPADVADGKLAQHFTRLTQSYNIRFAEELQRRDAVAIKAIERVRTLVNPGPSPTAFILQTSKQVAAIRHLVRPGDLDFKVVNKNTSDLSTPPIDAYESLKDVRGVALEVYLKASPFGVLLPKDLNGFRAVAPNWSALAELAETVVESAKSREELVMRAKSLVRRHPLSAVAGMMSTKNSIWSAFIADSFDIDTFQWTNLLRDFLIVHEDKEVLSELAEIGSLTVQGTPSGTTKEKYDRSFGELRQLLIEAEQVAGRRGTVPDLPEGSDYVQLVVKSINTTDLQRLLNPRLRASGYFPKMQQVLHTVKSMDFRDAVKSLGYRDETKPQVEKLELSGLLFQPMEFLVFVIQEVGDPETFEAEVDATGYDLAALYRLASEKLAAHKEGFWR